MERIGRVILGGSAYVISIITRPCIHTDLASGKKEWGLRLWFLCVFSSRGHSVLRSLVRIGIGVLASTSLPEVLAFSLLSFSSASLSTIYVDDTMKVSDATKILYLSI